MKPIILLTAVTICSTAYCQPPTFSCTTTAYLFTNDPTAIYGLNISSGVCTLLDSPLIANPPYQKLNAFGFNRQDNYIWGYRIHTHQLVRVASDFTVDTFSIIGLPITPDGFVVGSISDEGVMYLFSYDLDTIYKIDLDPASSSYLELIDAVYSQRTDIFDWAFDPIDGNLYTISKYFNIVRFDTLGVRTVLGHATGAGIDTTDGFFGGIFIDSIGHMFVSANSTGKIYEIMKPNLGDTTVILFSQGPIAAANNDGAFCDNARISSVPEVPSNSDVELSGVFMNNTLTISVESPELLLLNLYDIASRKMLQRKFIERTTLDLSPLATGVYIYQIQNGNQWTKTGKLMKN